MSYQNDEIIKWAIDSIEQHYADDVSLLLLYGSYENGTAHDFSDVDFYFIPKTDYAYNLSQTFIINEIGYDLFPMSWERVEGLAELHESLIPCLGDVKILYANSLKDEQRFKDLQLKLHENLNNKTFMIKKAHERLAEAKQSVGNLIIANSLSEMRFHSAFMILKLSECVAFLNQTYFHRGIKTQYEDLKQLRYLPVHFMDLYDFIIEAKSEQELQFACMALLRSTEFLLNSQVIDSTDVNYDNLIGRYEELCSSFNKIYMQCHLQKRELVYLTAAQVQQELNAISSEFNLPTLDLLQYYDAMELQTFSKQTRGIEAQLVALLDEYAIPIRMFRDITHFLTK